MVDTGKKLTQAIIGLDQFELVPFASYEQGHTCFKNLLQRLGALFPKPTCKFCRQQKRQMPLCLYSYLFQKVWKRKLLNSRNEVPIFRKNHKVGGCKKKYIILISCKIAVANKVTRSICT